MVKNATHILVIRIMLQATKSIVTKCITRDWPEDKECILFKSLFTINTDTSNMNARVLSTQIQYFYLSLYYVREVTTYTRPGWSNIIQSLTKLGMKSNFLLLFFPYFSCYVCKSSLEVKTKSPIICHCVRSPHIHIQSTITDFSQMLII